MSTTPDFFEESKSLRAFEELIARVGNRQKRLLSLLKPHNNTDNGDWFMFCPPCFNDPLDLKETLKVGGKGREKTWTQGSMFSFKAGDTIYDTPAAYLPWREALKTIKCCVSVEKATDAAPGVAGLVSYQRSVPKNGKLVFVATKETTQAGFVRFLITGDDSDHETVVSMTS